MSTIEHLAACVRFREAPDFAWIVEHAPDGTLDAAWASPDEPLADKLFLLQELGRPRPAWKPWRGPLNAVITAYVRRDAARVGSRWEAEVVAYFRRLERAPDHFWESLEEEVEKTLRGILPDVRPIHTTALVRNAALIVRGSPRVIDTFVRLLHGSADELLEVLLAVAPAPTYNEILAAIDGTA